LPVDELCLKVIISRRVRSIKPCRLVLMEVSDQ
jgi:hypothetical protein